MVLAVFTVAVAAVLMIDTEPLVVTSIISAAAVILLPPAIVSLRSKASPASYVLGSIFWTLFIILLLSVILPKSSFIMRELDDDMLRMLPSFLFLGCALIASGDGRFPAVPEVLGLLAFCGTGFLVYGDDLRAAISTGYSPQLAEVFRYIFLLVLVWISGINARGGKWWLMLLLLAVPAIIYFGLSYHETGLANAFDISAGIVTAAMVISLRFKGFASWCAIVIPPLLFFLSLYCPESVSALGHLDASHLILLFSAGVMMHGAYVYGSYKKLFEKYECYYRLFRAYREDSPFSAECDF